MAGTCSFFGSDVSFLIFFLDDDRPLKLLALDRLLVADDVSDGETCYLYETKRVSLRKVLLV